MAGDRPLLVCEHVNFSYLERFPALDDVSLTVHEGERIALLGANGSGKSTLLQLLDGLIFPQSGSYRAFGEEITERSLDDEQLSMAFRSRVGFVFQNSEAQVFSPTVRDELAFGPLQLGLDSDAALARVHDILAMLDITDLADRAPFQLSGGQKKKVALASVLTMNPQVLLFDEPTATLDPRTQVWLLELTEQLAGADRTLIHATHELDLLPRIADRCLVFGENHRIVAEGSPAQILAQRDLLLSVNLIHEHTVLPAL